MTKCSPHRRGAAPGDTKGIGIGDGRMVTGCQTSFIASAASRRPSSFTEEKGTASGPTQAMWTCGRYRANLNRSPCLRLD